MSTRRVGGIACRTSSAKEEGEMRCDLMDLISGTAEAGIVVRTRFQIFYLVSYLYPKMLSLITHFLITFFFLTCGCLLRGFGGRSLEAAFIIESWGWGLLGPIGFGRIDMPVVAAKHHYQIFRYSPIRLMVQFTYWFNI